MEPDPLIPFCWERVSRLWNIYAPLTRFTRITFASLLCHQPSKVAPPFLYALLLYVSEAVQSSSPTVLYTNNTRVHTAQFTTCCFPKVGMIAWDCQLERITSFMSEIEYEQLQHKRLHFLGIGGRGCSSMAQIAQHFGAQVTGCDKSASYTTQALEESGIPVHIGHSPEHLTDADALIYLPAVLTYDPDNLELAAAQTRGIPTLIWQDLLGRWAKGKCTISVSGVHGKGTTTTLLAYMLLDAGFDPNCFVGAIVPRFNSSFRLADSQYFVNEADEYNYNFCYFHPRIAVVTSIEYEHPEFFADVDAMLGAFERFIRGMDMQGDWPFPPTAVINAGSAGCRQLIERLHDWPGRIVTYKVKPSESVQAVDEHSATYVAYDVREGGGITHFRLHTQEQGGDVLPSGKLIQYQLPGIYNVENAVAALAAAHAAGVSFDSALRTLENYEGVKRRFEVRHRGPLEIDGETRDVIIIDDYAHHPTAISLTLEAARKRFPGRRLVHARDLVAAIAKGSHFAHTTDEQVFYGGDLQNVEAVLRKAVRSGDVVIIMGSGTIYTITKHLLHE